MDTRKQENYGVINLAEINGVGKCCPCDCGGCMSCEGYKGLSEAEIRASEREKCDETKAEAIMKAIEEHKIISPDFLIQIVRKARASEREKWEKINNAANSTSAEFQKQMKEAYAKGYEKALGNSDCFKDGYKKGQADHKKLCLEYAFLNKNRQLTAWLNAPMTIKKKED